MLNTQAIKRDIIYALMLQQMYSLNHVWLMYEVFVQQKAPELYGNEQYYLLFEDYGLDEARRLVRALGFPREGINDLARYLKYSHWAFLRTSK